MSEVLEQIANLSPERRDLLVLLLNKKKGEAGARTRVPRSRETNTFPLSFAQQRFWVLNQLEADNAVHNIGGGVRMSGQLKRHALERALFEIVSRHEALRTTFKQVDGEPVQVIGPPQTLSLVSFSLESLPAAQAEAEAMMLAQREWQQSFDLESGPLFRTKLLRLASEEHILLLTMHHIIFDAWSMGIFIRELAVLYEAYASGNPTPLAGAPVQYVDFAIAQREWLQGELLDKQSAYWKKKLRGAPSLLELPTDRPRPAAQSLRGASYPVSISADLTGALKEICGQERATLFMGLLALFKVLLYRYTNQSDIVVGVPISGRNKPGFDEVLGCFVNTLALRTELSGDLTFRELLAQVRVMTLEAFDHQDLPFEKLVEASQAVRDISHSPLFQVMFNLQNTGAAAPQLMNLELSPFEIDNGTAKFDLTLDLTETAEGLEGLFNYNSDLFNAATIQRMTGHFEQLLAAVTANPAQRISALSLLTPAEEQLQVEWNRTEKVYPQSHCIHQIFENQVKRSPTAPALVVEGESLTYSELNARANQLAHYLRSLGVGPEVLVGLHVERSVEMVVAVLGILKAGGAYLPLDPSYPTERLSFMLDDAQVPVLITGENVPEGLVSERVKVVVLEEELKRIEQEPDENLTDVDVEPQNLAYVIYTSGSTGRPKGVLITHRAVVNHNFGIAALYGLHPHDRVLQFASLSFDVAVEEMFPTWLRGGCVVLRPEGVLSSHTDFFEFLKKERISVVNLTTPYWNELMAEAARTGVRVNGSLRLAAVGGEIGLPEGFAFARKQVGDGVRLMNVYGPTETTVTNTVYEVNGAAAHEEAVSVPIGRPIANTQLYILDAQQQLLPVGVGGELHIGTDSIARGYLNRPEQTAEKFIPHPFSDEPGARLYKTGDVARFLSDGNVEFLGRVDHQVKVRGFRIELGEIEAALKSHTDLQETAVVVREDEPGDKRIVAYVVPKRGDGISPIELWPSLGEYQVYNELMYFAMTNDEQRNSRYGEAINRLVKDKTVVEIGTGRDAILARMCVAAGASKVYAIEALDESRIAAEALVKRLGLSDKIILIGGYSFDVELPEKADVCVSELIGTIGGSEGTAAILNDARRFLKDDGLMIPESCVTKFAAAQLPDELLESPRFTEVSGDYAARIFEQVGFEFDVRVCVRNFPRENLLSEAGTFEDLDFSGYVETSYAREIVLKVVRQGRLDGFLLWINLSPIENVVIDNLQAEYNWLPVYFPVFDPGVEVVEGDIIKAVCSASLSDNGVNPDYQIAGTLLKRNGEVISFAHNSTHHQPAYQATEFYRRLFSQGDKQPQRIAAPKITAKNLRAYLSERLPDYMIPAVFVTLDELPLTSNGKVDRKALPVPDQSRADLDGVFVAARTAVEEVLTEIWSQVLGIEQIGIHDNFFELGGDSILSIQIINKASQAGLHFTPRQLFQHQTIAALAAVASINTAIEAEQGTVTGEVPLTPVQHWFFEHNVVDPQHFNQALLLELRQPLDPTLLPQALAHLHQHHDALRLRFEQTEAGWRQRNAGSTEDCDFSVVNFANLEVEEQAAAIEQVATTVQGSLNLATGPLLKVVLFELGPERAGRLLLVAHHLVIDGFSWRILLEDLQKAYLQLKRGEDISLGPKTSSFRQWGEGLRKYAATAALDANYWLDAKRRSIPQLPRDKSGPNTVASAQSLTVSLTPEETRALIHKVPAAYHTQINDALLTAVAQAFKRWSGRHLLVELEGHGREELLVELSLSRTVGWFTGIYPVLLEVAEGASAGEALQSIKEQLRAVPQRGIGYGLLRYLGGEEMKAELRALPAAEVLFNYFGQLDQVLAELPLFAMGRESTGPSHSLRGARSHLIEINGSIIAGQLQMSWTYSENVHYRATIERVAGAFINALRNLIAYCQSEEAGGFTPSDFPLARLDQRKLAKLSTLINKKDKSESLSA